MNEPVQVAKVVAGDVIDLPAGRGQLAKPPAVAGQLIAIRMPLTVVLDREPNLASGEVDPCDEVAASHDRILRRGRLDASDHQRHPDGRLGR